MFFFMPMLKELNLDQNELKEIPADWQFLTTLEILSLKVLALIRMFVFDHETGV